jgi:hypothetical protein
MADRPKPPPPVPTAAKAPALEANPFLDRESSREVDAAWPEPAASVPQVIAPPIAAPPPAPQQIAAPPPPPIAHIEPPEEPRAAPAQPSPQPAPKKSRGKAIAFVVLAISVLGGAGVAYQRGLILHAPKVERAAPSSTADETASAEPSAPIVEAKPPPTFAVPQPPPSASAAKKPAAGSGAAAAAVPADPSKTGTIDTTPLPAGRKIVVDGRMIGTSPRKFVVRCGSHRFQIGDLPAETLDLPCGGEISFSD